MYLLLRLCEQMLRHLPATSVNYVLGVGVAYAYSALLL